MVTMLRARSACLPLPRRAACRILGAVARRKPSARAIRRARAREHEGLVRDLERLARLEPGGSPERPIVIDSPARVEIIAQAKPCPLCGGPLRVEEHAAAVSAGVRLRIARVACSQCRTRRSFYFMLPGGPVH